MMLARAHRDFPKNSRAANLMKFEPDDRLYFLARLVKWKNGNLLKNQVFI